MRFLRTDDGCDPNGWIVSVAWDDANFPTFLHQGQGFWLGTRADEDE